MTEDTGPVTFDTPPEVPETEEQQRERITKIRDEIRQKMEDREVQAAIAAGLMAFFVWLKNPYKNFLMLHMFPNRETRRKNHARKTSIQKALRRLSKVSEGLTKGRVTLRAKRAAQRLLVAANDRS